MHETYSIIDLDGYADAVRTEAASDYSSTENNLDDFISLNQVKYIVDSYSLGFDDDNYHIIDKNTHNDIVNEVADWIFNVGLAKLAASNKLECAWDTNINGMVFWLPENPTNNGVNNDDPRANTSSETRDGQN